MSIDFVKDLQIKTYTDDRGKLSVIEGAQTVPFEIKRAFVTYDPQADAVRGAHANRSANFVMVNLCGCCKLRVSDAVNERVISFCEPMQAVFLPNMIWKEIFDYSEDSVVLFLSDSHYDKDDYLYDRGEFLRCLSD